MIKVEKISIKALVISIMAVIGVATVVLSLVSGNMFKNAALEKEAEVLQRVVGVASGEVLSGLYEKAKEMGATAQKNRDFRRAFRNINEPQNKEFVVSHLNEQFAQRYVTLGILQLAKLRVYDKKLKFLAESSEGWTGMSRKMPDFLYEVAVERKGADRFKALDGLSTSEAGAVYSVLVPIGGLRLYGYLEVVVSPSYNLQRVAEILQAPIRIAELNGEERFVHENWPEALNSDMLEIQYTLPTKAGEPGLNITAVENISAFNDSFNQTQMFNVLAFFVIMAAGIGVALMVFGRFIFKPLRGLVENMERASEGDLTMDVKAQGLKELHNLSSSLARLVDSLRNQVSEIHTNATSLSTAAEELSIVTGETSQAVQNQQSETEQVATAINEMSATVQEVARHAEDAATAARSADEETSIGKNVVSQSIEQINQLASEIENATQVINKLEADSENIGTVMDVIRGIAEQTNLLALNAAIEAARAGEQGRGFAVVADEVRTLASRTQESTEEIQTMIESLQSGARDAVHVMDESKERTQRTVEQAAKAGESLESITVAVSNINEMNTQIAGAAEEQSAVAEEINKSISNISHVGEKTAAGANTTANSSETLAQLAGQLQNVVNQFKI